MPLLNHPVQKLKADIFLRFNLLWTQIVTIFRFIVPISDLTVFADRITVKALLTIKTGRLQYGFGMLTLSELPNFNVFGEKRLRSFKPEKKVLFLIYKRTDESEVS